MRTLRWKAPLAPKPFTRRVFMSALTLGLGACGGGAAPELASQGPVTRDAPALPAARAFAPASLVLAPLNDDALFDWAERQYPQYFPSARATQAWGPYVYRFYPETQAYLAVTDQSLVQVLGPQFGPDILTVGPKSQFTCSVSPEACVSTRDYQQSSYRLAQPRQWFSSDSLRAADGSRWVADNPLLVMQTVQVDINNDGVEDVLSYDSYSLALPITNPPPALYANKNGTLVRTPWTGQTLRSPHGVKLLVGDFNRDGYPDVFSLVAIDPQGGGFPDLQDFNHMLWGNAGGLAQATVTEFTDWRGFWYAGASGDIDNDGALDLVIFNFHFLSNGVRIRILWGDGKGGFRSDDRGIGTLATVDQAELVDVNGDGKLDLVVDVIADGKRTARVLWGNGSGFDPARSSSFQIGTNQYVGSLNFADLDRDGTQEIILSGTDDRGQYWLLLFKSPDAGQSWVDKTADYFDVSQSSQRFDRLYLTDIDRDGRLDLFAPDRRDNIRWIFSGGKFRKQ